VFQQNSLRIKKNKFIPLIVRVSVKLNSKRVKNNFTKSKMSGRRAKLPKIYIRHFKT